MIRRIAVMLGVAFVLAAGYASAQFGYFREGSLPPKFAPPHLPDHGFVFCRLMYNRVRMEPMGIGWATDYPYAEINLMTRLSELTKTYVEKDAQGNPTNHWVVRLTDPSLFRCPFTMASDAGTIGFSPEEAANLRDYLLKGGFLWVDDFWGSAAWEQWESEISKVLPPGEYPIQDVERGDPILKSLFIVDEMPQITNIQFWRRVGGGTTSERGYDSDEPHFRVIRDAHGRVMVVMTHNTDVADSWEREGEDPAFFYQFSPKGYAFGIDVLIHVMTH